MSTHGTGSEGDYMSSGSAREGPIIQRALRAILSSPLRLGLLLSGTLLFIFIVVEYAFGRLPDLLATDAIRDIRIAIVHCLLVGYLAGAFVAVRRGARRTVVALAPALDLSVSELARIEISIARFSARALVIAGTVGLLLAVIGPYITPPVPATVWDPRSWSPEVAWHRILGPVVALLIGWFGYALVESSRRVSRLAASLDEIDLLNLRPLAPFTRLGLRNALLGAGLLAVGSLFLLESGFVVLIGLMSAVTVVVAALALLLPVQGVHRRIRAVKESELAWSRAKIHAARADLVSDRGATPGELADLVAYHDIIETVPEWPFALSTYVRFTLYLLLPLAAWVAGALIDGLIQSAFADLL